jgi:hypothetical protein
MVLEAERNHTFARIFAKYAQLAGYQVTSMRFLFDGDAVYPKHTPNMLMEVQAANDTQEAMIQIDCFLENRGE